MDKAELIWIATVAIGKGYGYEQMKYSDYLYGNEDKIDDVWAYVDECLMIGTKAFKEKYKEYRMYI